MSAQELPSARSGPARPSAQPEAQGDFEVLKTHDGENVPHWQYPHSIYHISFRLVDSVPSAKREEWIAERKAIEERAKLDHCPLTRKKNQQTQFLYSDRIEKFLDTGHGECLLARADIAALVEESLQHFDGDRYCLHAWCVMPNHVHVLVEPRVGEDLSGIIHSWKSFTAHRANRLLCREGPFWQKDAYNHIIRSEGEYRYQMEYVWTNPEKAGLKNWRWRWKNPQQSAPK